MLLKSFEILVLKVFLIKLIGIEISILEID